MDKPINIADLVIEEAAVRRFSPVSECLRNCIREEIEGDSPLNMADVAAQKIIKIYGGFPSQNGEMEKFPAEFLDGLLSSFSVFYCALVQHLQTAVSDDKILRLKILDDIDVSGLVTSYYESLLRVNRKVQTHFLTKNTEGE